jgi:hypothetical protein
MRSAEFYFEHFNPSVSREQRPFRHIFEHSDPRKSGTDPQQYRFHLDQKLGGPTMSAQYSAFARPNLDASFFDREEVQADETPMFATPVYAQRTSTRSVRSGINPAWIAVPAVVLAVGAGAYMMSQRSEPTVASTKPPPAALAPTITPQPPEVAANTVEPVNPSPAATATASTDGRVMTRQPAPVRVARAKAPARTEAATAATGTGVDASATIPATPQPYSGSAQTSAPAPAPVIAPPAPTVSAEPAPTPEAATPPIAPQVPDSPTSPPTN